MRFSLRPEFGANVVTQAVVFLTGGGALLAFGGPARAVLYLGLIAAVAIVVADRTFSPERPVVSVVAYFVFMTAALMSSWVIA